MTTCQTCGQPVRVVSSDEGTHHFTSLALCDAIAAVITSQTDNPSWSAHCADVILADSAVRAALVESLGRIFHEDKGADIPYGDGLYCRCDDAAAAIVARMLKPGGDER